MGAASLEPGIRLLPSPVPVAESQSLSLETRFSLSLSLSLSLSPSFRASITVIKNHSRREGGKGATTPKHCHRSTIRPLREKEKRRKRGKKEDIKKKRAPARRGCYRGLPSSDNTLRGPPALRKPLTRAPINQPFSPTIHTNPRSSRGTLDIGVILRREYLGAF